MNNKLKSHFNNMENLPDKNFVYKPNDADRASLHISDEQNDFDAHHAIQDFTGGKQLDKTAANLSLELIKMRKVVGGLKQDVGAAEKEQTQINLTHFGHEKNKELLELSISKIEVEIGE
jgi:hypothetical protein